MAADPAGSGERILIVEDDAPYRSYLEETLKHDGHITAAVGDAEAALGCIQGFQPTVLITDLAMTGMDGLTLCREVRGRPGWEHLPILVLSGAEDSASIGEVVGLGLIWYLRKGATGEHLRKTVANLIARGRKASGIVGAEPPPDQGRDSGR